MKIHRIKQVIAITGIPRSTIYKYISENRFPKSIPLGPRSVGWLDSEISEWLQKQIEKREQ